MADDERPDAPDEEPTNAAPDEEGQTPEEPAAEEPAAEEPAAEEPAPSEPVAEEPPAPEPEPPAEEPAPAEPVAEEPPAPEPEEPAEPAADAPPAPEPAQPAEPAADAPPGEERRPRRPREDAPAEPDVVPGAHLEPDLVLEEQRRAEEEADYDRYATAEAETAPGEEAEQPARVEEQPVARTPLEIAADARYQATGKRKSAIARVILRPGEGTYKINGRGLDEYFPRPTLQRTARLPLETAGYETRMDVVARIHGGGVSAQAGALRHGIARALVEADPNLRAELKRRGFLTRDAREKERKKAGLKKARKRPQFSKR
jgi:small subunit ribosomal protein S9